MCDRFLGASDGLPPVEGVCVDETAGIFDFLLFAFYAPQLYTENQLLDITACIDDRHNPQHIYYRKNTWNKW